MHKALAAATLLVALAGCNDDQGDPADFSGTSLDIIVTADEGAEPRLMTLRCDPPKGDHPQPAQACAALEKAGAGIFDPVPDDQACTMIFGGPQTANIRGSYDGERVNANFSRSNGCEIDRWEALGTTVFDIPLQ